MKRIFLWMLVGLIALVTARPALRAAQNSGNTQSSGAAEGEQNGKTSSANPGTYIIGPQDVLDVNVWKEPNISQTVPVRPDGKISLPLLNDVQAAGLTPMELQKDITERLKKFIDQPQVTVIVSQINSRRIYVLGQVPRPGAFPMFPNMTVLQALAEAGGYSQFANLSKMYVLRNENGKQKIFPFNYKDVVRGERANQNILLKPGDTIVVP